jgi:hypothetical protein
MSNNPFNNSMESVPNNPDEGFHDVEDRHDIGDLHDIEDDYWGTPTDASVSGTVIPNDQLSSPASETAKAKKVLITSLIGVLLILLAVTALIVVRNFTRSTSDEPAPASDRVAVQQTPDSDKSAPHTTEKGIAPQSGAVNAPAPKQGTSPQPQPAPADTQPHPNPSQSTTTQSQGNVDLSQLTFSDIQTGKAMVLDKSVRSQDGVLLFRVDYIFSGTETRVFTYVPKSVFDSVKVGDVADLTFRTVNDGSIAIIR